MPYVYLIHFDERHPNGNKPQHYVGVCVNLRERINQHAAGSGAVLIREMFKVHRISFRVVKTWKFSEYTSAYKWERRIKRAGHYDRKCPACRGEKVHYSLNRYRRKAAKNG